MKPLLRPVWCQVVGNVYTQITVLVSLAQASLPKMISKLDMGRGNVSAILRFAVAILNFVAAILSPTHHVVTPNLS